MATCFQSDSGSKGMVDHVIMQLEILLVIFFCFVLFHHSVFLFDTLYFDFWKIFQELQL